VNVTVICFGAMREHLPERARDNRAELEVRDDATVGDVVDALGAPRALAFAVLLDGAQASLDARVSEGSEITLMPPFAGGSSDLQVGDPISAVEAVAEEMAEALQKYMGVTPDTRVLGAGGG
jgi:molybdopterin converting factor small subunit